MHQISLTSIKIYTRNAWEKSKGLGCWLHTARDPRVLRRQRLSFSEQSMRPTRISGRRKRSRDKFTGIYVLTSLKSAFLQSCPTCVRCSRQKTPRQPLQMNGRKSMQQKELESRASRQLRRGFRIGVRSSNLATFKSGNTRVGDRQAVKV